MMSLLADTALHRALNQALVVLNKHTHRFPLCTRNTNETKDTDRKCDIDNVHTAPLPHRKLKLPRMPERCGVVQAGKNIIYPGPCVPIFQPAQLNSPPQLVAEAEPFCPLRFYRSDPLHNIVDNEDIRLKLDIGMVSTQYLGYPQLTVYCNEHHRANTHLIDHHPESVAIGLSGRSVVF